MAFEVMRNGRTGKGAFGITLKRTEGRFALSKGLQQIYGSDYRVEALNDGERRLVALRFNQEAESKSNKKIHVYRSGGEVNHKSFVETARSYGYPSGELLPLREAEDGTWIVEGKRKGANLTAQWRFNSSGVKEMLCIHGEGHLVSANGQVAPSTHECDGCCK